AAAVAAGAVPFAVGTDAGGSIRIPASFCGVTGLKPTHGAVPTRGAVPLTYSQDTVGILARSARDVALVIENAAGVQLHAAVVAIVERSRPLDGVRVGIDRAFVEQRASPDVARALEDVLRVFGELGATVVEIELSSL